MVSARAVLERVVFFSRGRKVCSREFRAQPVED